MTQTNKIKAQKLNDIGSNRNEYGINSRNSLLSQAKQSYPISDAKSEKQLHMRRQSSVPQKDIPPLSLSSLKNSHRTSLKQYPEQDTERQLLLTEQKQQTYRNQIHELIKQNESMKLKQRQTQIRVDELQSRLRQNSQPSQEGSRQRMSINSQQSHQIYQNSDYTTNLFGRYQLPIRRMLQLYGCSRQQTSIEECRSEGEIITFLVKLLSEKWQFFNSKQRETHDKVAKQQRQVSKVRESLRMLTDTNELFKHRENKHKQKMEEARKEWMTACEKLTRSESLRQKMELNRIKLEKILQQQQAQMIRMQEQSKARQDQQQSHIEQLQTQIAEAHGQFNRLQVKCQQLEGDLEEARDLAEECRLKLKVKEDQLSRTSRQVVRWKERFDWIEKERISAIDETVRSVVESKIAFHAPYNKEMMRNELDIIKESNRDVTKSSQLKKARLPENIVKPIEQPIYIDKKLHNNKYQIRSEVHHQRQAQPQQRNGSNHNKDYPIRKIFTTLNIQKHQQGPLQQPLDSASNLMQTMLSKLELYANKVVDRQ